MGRKVELQRDSVRKSGGKGTVLSHDCGAGYMILCICQNPENSIAQSKFYCILIFLISTRI